MEEPLSLLHQWAPSGLEMFPHRREASSVETKSSLGGHAGTHVCPSQRDRAPGLKRSGWAPPWKALAPMVKAPSCRACRQRECGTNVAPMSMRRATINAGVLPMAAEHCHLLQGVQILEATRASRTDAAVVNSRIRDTLSPPWRPLVPPTVKIVKGDIALPLRTSRGAKAAGVRPREGEASLRRKAGPDGTSMAPFIQGMGETWCVFSVYLTIIFFCVFFFVVVVCLRFCLAFFSYANFRGRGGGWVVSAETKGVVNGQWPPLCLIIQSLQTRQLCFTDWGMRRCLSAVVTRQQKEKGGDACMQYFTQFVSVFFVLFF